MVKHDPRGEAYDDGWECDQQGEWKPCYAPGCQSNRRRIAQAEVESFETRR